MRAEQLVCSLEQELNCCYVYIDYYKDDIKKYKQIIKNLYIIIFMFILINIIIGVY